MGCGAERWRGLPRVPRSRPRPLVHRRYRGLKKETDMTIADLLQPEFDQEMATTRRVLERVPEDKFSWKPHDKSFSMGNLASHIANMIAWANDTMNRVEFDLTSVTPEEMNKAAKSRAELLAWFDTNTASARGALAR